MKKINGYEKVKLPKTEFFKTFEQVWNECMKNQPPDPLMGKKARKKFNQYVAQELDKQINPTKQQ